MRLLAIFLLVLFYTGSSGNAFAQVSHYDSLAVDSLVADAGVTNSFNVKGMPDGQQVRLEGGSVLLLVQFSAGKRPVTFKKGSELHFYWNRKTADSNAGAIQFLNWSDGPPVQGPIVKIWEHYPLNVEQETTIPVPDDGYNALSISVTGDTSNSFYLDAIVLMQAGDAGVSEQKFVREIVLNGYPNPFLRSMPSTVRIMSPIEGKGMLIVSDALGREIEQIPLGQVDRSDREVTLSLGRAGVFFGRLLIDGNPVGAPLKLTSE
jgi:hypothetical protein